MTLFRHPDLKAAYQHVADGGQALYLRRRFPKEQQTAWLIDNQADRLYETARRLGARTVRILRQGRDGQCVDLCCGPLNRAVAECSTDELQLGWIDRMAPVQRAAFIAAVDRSMMKSAQQIFGISAAAIKRKSL